MCTPNNGFCFTNVDFLHVESNTLYNEICHHKEKKQILYYIRSLTENIATVSTGDGVIDW